MKNPEENRHRNRAPHSTRYVLLRGRYLVLHRTTHYIGARPDTSAFVQLTRGKHIIRSGKLTRVSCALYEKVFWHRRTAWVVDQGQDVLIVVVKVM